MQRKKLFTLCCLPALGIPSPAAQPRLKFREQSRDFRQAKAAEIVSGDSTLPCTAEVT